MFLEQDTKSNNHRTVQVYNIKMNVLPPWRNMERTEEFNANQ